MAHFAKICLFAQYKNVQNSVKCPSLGHFFDAAIIQEQPLLAREQYENAARPLRTRGINTTHQHFQMSLIKCVKKK